MKNKICYVLLSLLISFAFINNVFADEITISANASNTEIVKGKETTITVNLKSDVVIKECLIQFTSEGNIEKISESDGGSDWKIDKIGADGHLIKYSSSDLSSATAPVNGDDIIKLTYQVNGTGKVIVKTNECITSSDVSLTYKDVTVDLTAVDSVDDTTLSSLTVTGGDPFNFSSKQLTYAIKLNSSTFGLNMKTSNTDYRDDIVVKDVDGNIITDTDNIKFSDSSDGLGLMQLFITVSEKTTYQLALSYIQPELDNSLSYIKINGSDLFLEDDKVEYNIEVDSDVDIINISVALKDSENFQIGKDSNINGMNDSFSVPAHILIVVEPKSTDLGSTSKSYLINIKKNKNADSTGNIGGSESNNDKDNNSNVGNNNSNVDEEGNVTQNQDTGDISMFVMAVILIASLVGSVILYQKNLESYR